MKVIRADFVTSAAAGGRADGIPTDGLAQIAFAGRSNVGKSTLLNALARTTLARTSAAPGKTRLANIFKVTVDGGHGGVGRWSVYFVDLPGYGYARGGGDSAAELAAVAAAYFSVAPRDSDAALQSRATGVSVLHLIDSRHPGLESDSQAARWFDSLGVARHVVATKIDKLSRAERMRNLKEIERVLGHTPLPVSATSAEGLDDLWRLIAKVSRDRHQ